MNQNHEFYSPEIEAEDANNSSIAINRDLSRLLEKDSIVFDIGANRGQFASEVLEIISEIQIFSFEPVEEAFEDLVNLSKKNKQIIPIQSAVSIKTGNKTFYITESDVGSSLLKPKPNQPSKWLTLEEEVIVRTTRLDDFIIENELNKIKKTISLLKTDAQGADLDVINSAGEFLNPEFIKAVLTEINFREFYENQQSFHDIFKVMDNRGYRLAWLYPHRSYDKWLWWADVLFIPKSL